MAIHEVFHDGFFAGGGASVLPLAVEVPAGSSCVGKVREPWYAYESSPSIKELAVGNGMGSGDLFPPFPGISSFIPGPPCVRCGMFLRVALLSGTFYSRIICKTVFVIIYRTPYIYFLLAM